MMAHPEPTKGADPKRADSKCADSKREDSNQRRRWWSFGRGDAYDVDDALRASGLPVDLAENIRSLVRSARLRRVERLDVAEELISHFGEGMDAGRSEEELTRAFASSELAAGLLHRAKIRQRGGLAQAWRYGKFAALILTAIYVGGAARSFLGQPTITSDFRAEFAAPAEAVPEGDRAWPEYRDVLLQLTDRELDWYSGSGAIAQLALPPGDVVFDKFVAWHAENQALLPAIRRAAAKPGLGFIPRFEIDPADHPLWPDDVEPGGEGLWEQSLGAVKLPYLAELRLLARFVQIDLALALDSGDGARVAADIAACAGMARHARELPNFINDLVALAILAGAVEPVLTHLENGGRLPDGTVQALAGFDSLMNVRLEGKRLWFHDFLQRAYTDNGTGDGRLTFNGYRALHDDDLFYGEECDAPTFGDRLVFAVAQPALSVVELSRSDIADAYDSLLDSMIQESQLEPWVANFRVIENQVEYWAGNPVLRQRYAPIVTFMPATARAVVIGWEAAMRRDALLVVNAVIEQYQATGEVPGSLDQIDLGLIGETGGGIPLDMFDGAPLRIRVESDGFSLYSIGRNRIDDGGGGPREPAPSWQGSENDDWTVLRWIERGSPSAPE